MSEANQCSVKIVGVGAGGHCRVLLDLIKKLKIYEVVALTDRDMRLHDEWIEGTKIIGSDSKLTSLRESGIEYAFVGIGSVGDCLSRKIIYQNLISGGFHLPSLIHPSAVISSNVQMGNSCQVMAGVIVNTNTTVGNNTILNSSATIEHDCQIGEHVHVSPGVTLGGGVRISDGAHVGIGATIREGISIGTGSFIAGGAMVVTDVLANQKVRGVPAKTYYP